MQDRIALVDSQNTTTIKDDNIIGNPGIGGQGVLPIPIVYNGWLQNIP